MVRLLPWIPFPQWEVMKAEIKVEAVEVAAVALPLRALCLERIARASSARRRQPGPECDGSGKICASKCAKPIVKQNTVNIHLKTIQ